MSISQQPQDGSGYVLGAVHGNTKPYASFETKQTAEYLDGTTGSGGGYERWRSYEYRPETSRQGKEDVHVYVHRLHYLVHPDLMGVSISEAIRELGGCDVHHQNGCRFDNRLDNYELLDHAEHSALTQAELRAHGEDAKQAAVAAPTEIPEFCDGCGGEMDWECTSEGFDGVRCLSCAKQDADGHTIHPE